MTCELLGYSGLLEPGFRRSMKSSGSRNRKLQWNVHVHEHLTANTSFESRRSASAAQLRRYAS